MANEFQGLSQKEAIFGHITAAYLHFYNDNVKCEWQQLHNGFYRLHFICDQCDCRLGRISFDPHGKIIGYKLGENFPDCPECEEE